MNIQKHIGEHQHLTNSLCERTRPPKRPLGGHATKHIWDDQLAGFALRVTDGGKKSFILQARCAGRTIRSSLGEFGESAPAINLAQARGLAMELKAQYSRGVDPAREREREQARELAEPTFGALWDAYLDDIRARGLKSFDFEKRRLEQHCLSWRERKARDISHRDVDALRKTIARKRLRQRGVKNGPVEQGGEIIANRVIAIINRIYRFAAQPESPAPFEGRNPVAGIKRFEEPPRERFLSIEELHRVNAELLKERNPYARAFFPIAVMTGCRKMELLSARWEYVDFEAQTLRLPSRGTKTKKPRLLPLQPQVIDLLRQLPSFAQRAEGGFIFPAASGKGHRRGMKEAWERIRDRAKLPDVRIHDLRHSLASFMLSQGFGIALIGKVLGHARLSSTERYAHLAIAPQRAALDQTADMLFGAVAQRDNLN